MKVDVLSTAKRMVTILLCFALLSCFSVISYAESSGSITLTALDRESKTPVSEISFRLYKFASASENNGMYSYSYTSDFVANGMKMDFSDAYFPVHLMSFAQSNGLASEEKITDTDGKVVFEKLSLGAYLIVPESVTSGYINPTPFVVTVPMWDSANEQWLFSVDASPKIEAVKDEGEKTYLSVRKEWQGTGERPENIKVSLLKDGEVADTVTLSAENDWYFRWDNLDDNYLWNVVEDDVPAGYTASYEISQMTVVIVNTSDSPQEETTLPDDTTEKTTVPEEFFQTGQINWPVPIFSIAGLLLFSAGWAMLNIGKKEENNV